MREQKNEIDSKRAVGIYWNNLNNYNQKNK